MSSRIWRTSNGKQIRVKDMSMAHLHNTLNYVLEHPNNFAEEWPDVLQAEINKRLGRSKFNDTRRN